MKGKFIVKYAVGMGYNVHLNHDWTVTVYNNETLVNVSEVSNKNIEMVLAIFDLACDKYISPNCNDIDTTCNWVQNMD